MAQILVYFSRVVYKPQTTMFQKGFESDIKEAINPDATAFRYKRTWRFSKPQYYDGYFVGKLGFVSSAKEKVTFYDEKKKDFLEKSINARPTHYVQWVLDSSTQILAFETKYPDIKLGSFMGAFRGLLDKSANLNLTVEYIMESEKFFDWVERVGRITKFTAKIRKPNPKYDKRTNVVHDLLEETNADSAKIDITKAKDSADSLNTETTIRELVDYAKEGYSDINAQGFENGHERHFDSKRKLPTERIHIPIGLSVQQIWDSIIDAYKKFRR